MEVKGALFLGGYDNSEFLYNADTLEDLDFKIWRGVLYTNLYSLDNISASQLKEISSLISSSAS